VGTLGASEEVTNDLAGGEEAPAAVAVNPTITAVASSATAIRLNICITFLLCRCSSPGSEAPRFGELGPRTFGP
jgi:hypothetical protein